MTKILLIPAPSVGPSGRLRPYLPYGLLSLRALARPEVGVDLWLPKANLAERVHGSSAALVESLLEALPPLDEYRAVGLATMCSSLHHTLGLARELRRRAPELPLWLGGPHASAVAPELLDALPDLIDAIFLGESERSFAQALERHGSGHLSLEGISGIMTRGSPFVPVEPITDLDELPMVAFGAPELDLLRERAAGSEAGPTIPLEVARGCPGRCAFCSTRRFWGRKVRHKSLDRIIDEVLRVQAEAGLRRFEILGDNLSASRLWLRKLCHAFLSRAPETRWQCDLKLDRLREEDLDLLWRAGCRGFFIGIESGSQETLDRIGKEVNLDHELHILERALERGFEVRASLIVGFPWEQPDDLDRTFRLHARMLQMGVAQSQIWLLCPLPGTDLLLGEQAPDFDRLGSRLAMDGIPLDDETRALAPRFPQIFVQLGRYPTPWLNPRDLDATVATASQLNLLYHRPAHP